MKKITVASANKGKLAEFKEMLGNAEVIGYKQLADFEIEETGKTLRENALLKARAVWRRVGGNVLADDSGLTVEALGGEPGVRTARYAGENATDDENMDKLLAALDGEENRRAEFRCCLVLIDESGKEFVAEGVTKGRIAHEKRGSNGFGYNPIFFSDELGMTFGEADEAAKNSISHRGRALEKLKEYL